MQALLTVNIFAQSLLAALFGVGLFVLLLALPRFVNPNPQYEPDGATTGPHPSGAGARCAAEHRCS